MLLLIQQMPQLIDMTDADRLQATDDQWRRLPFVALTKIQRQWMLMNSEHISTLEDFEGVTMFSELEKVVLDVLVFPHSTVSCEHVLSKVNLIKTKPRNQLYRHSKWARTHL